MKLSIMALLLLISIGVLQAQQPFFQERVYKMNATGKTISASLLMPQNRVLLSGPVDGACGWCGNNNFLLVNTNLDTVWTRTGIETSRQEQDLSLTKDGNGFVFAATVENKTAVIPAAHLDDMLLQKFDLNGLLLWSKSYNFRSDIVRAVVPLNNGGYMLGGFGMIPNKDSGFSIVRTDNQGNIITQRSYIWNRFDTFNAMRLTQNGNIIVTGGTRNSSQNYRLKMMLLNQNGDSLKGTQLPVTDPTRQEFTYNPYNSVLSLTDGGFLVTGSVDTLQYYGLGMIVKVDSNLNLVWKYTYRSNPFSWKMYSRVKELADGSIIALAFQYHPHISNQFWIERFSANGQLLNSYPFTSNITNKLDAITLEALPDSSFIIGGGCYNAVPVGTQLTTHYGLYVARVKIPGLPAALPPITPGIVNGLAAEQNKTELYLGQSYPNPTSASAIIPYTLPVSTKQAQLIIRDITGREVGKYDIQKNSSSLEVQVGNLQNGLYTYTLVADGKPVATKKLAVMK
jgi:hypothetical protein